MATASFTPPGIYKSTLGKGTYLSCRDFPWGPTYFIKLPSPPLRARRRSIRCSLAENAPNSKAATLYSLGKNAAALALSYFFGSLLGREELAQLFFGQVSNLTAKGAAPVHFCVGAAALLFGMGVLIGHKWAAKSGSHCPNAYTCIGSNDSEHMPTDYPPTKRASVKRNALRKVTRSVKVVKDGASRLKLLQTLLKVILQILELPDI